MKAFAGLVVTAGLIAAIPIANAQTSVRHEAGKRRHHAASHSKRPYFVGSLDSMFRRLLRPGPYVPPLDEKEVAAAPARMKAVDATSASLGESTGTIGKANPQTPQILPTQKMPAAQGLE